LHRIPRSTPRRMPSSAPTEATTTSTTTCITAASPNYGETAEHQQLLARFVPTRRGPVARRNEATQQVAASTSAQCVGSNPFGH
jgi:hypothetical protein